jgi:ATP-dependent DNA helicase RecG
VDGKKIGVIEVPSGINKPYVLSGAIYVRIGPSTHKLTTAEQMRDFFQRSERIYFDDMPCVDFSEKTMIDKEFLRFFQDEARLSLNLPQEQIFKNLKLYTSEQKFKNGAVLFFSKQPEELIEKAVIRCIAFQGFDKRFIVDDKQYGGNLYNQYKQAMQWLRGKLDIRYDIEGQGAGPRKEFWEIPENVFKEAIINSLAHRDYYDRGAVTHIEVYDDRIEITNPGGLVSAISEEEFGKRSHSRNPLIFGLFARMHLVEQVGSGINRIQDLMTSAGLLEPVFQKQGFFTLILKRPKSSVKSSVKTADKIMKFIKNNSRITIAELAKNLKISTRAVEKHIAQLKSSGLIERIGSDKAGYWEVVSG